MAFDKSRFACVMNNASANMPRIFAYYNYGQDTITSAGYFPANVGIQNNDLLIVFTKDAGAIPAWHKLSVSGETVTAGSAMAYYTAPASNG